MAKAVGARDDLEKNNMTLMTVDNIGAVGLIIGEVDPYALPPNAITSSKNMIFRGDMAKQSYAFKNHATGFQDGPLALFPAESRSNTRWLYLTERGAQYFDFDSEGVVDHTDITRTSGRYYGDLGQWTACISKDVLYISEYSEPPQAKLVINDDSPFINLANWTVTDRCAALRAYKDVLFALNTVEGGIFYPMRARWSSVTNTGSVPVTWSEIDASKKAGYFDINESPGHIVDGRSLADSFLIYKPNGIVRVQFVGGQNQYSKVLVSNVAGAASRGALVEVKGKHIVFGNDDLFATDGFGVTSIATGRIRKDLFSRAKNLSTAFVCVDRNADEVWFCFSDDEFFIAARVAYIWNYRTDTWSFQDVPSVLCGEYGREGGLLPTARDVMLLGTSTAVIKKDFTTSIGTATIERTGLFYGASIRLLSTVYFNGKSSVPVTLTLGSEEAKGTGVVWSSPYTVTLGGSAKMDVDLSGRSFAWKISAPAGANLELNSLVFDFTDSFEAFV